MPGENGRQREWDKGEPVADPAQPRQQDRRDAPQGPIDAVPSVRDVPPGRGPVPISDIPLSVWLERVKQARRSADSSKSFAIAAEELLYEAYEHLEEHERDELADAVRNSMRVLLAAKAQKA